MIKNIVILLIILMIIVGFGGAQVSAIGVAIYDWAHDTPLSSAIWNGFVVWMKLMAIGLVGLFASIAAGVIYED